MADKKPVLLFVVCIENYDLFNRQSAIDSILCSLLVKLCDNYDVYVNSEPFVNRLEEKINRVSSLSNSHIFGRLVPKNVKQLFRDYRLFKAKTDLFNQIKDSVKPDIILELMRYGSDLGAKLSEYYRIPLIAYFDAPAVEENKYLRNTWSPFYKKVANNEKRTIKEADLVLVYSTAIRDFWMQKISGIDEKKFRVFQTLDYSRLKFNFQKEYSSTLTIGFVGSFLKWHKVENLVFAFNNLRTKGYDCKLLLIGAGEEFKTVCDMASNSKFTHDIELTGFIDGPNLEMYRNKIDIGVMPGTQWYCMPTKVFEYGASGIISIAPGTESIKKMFTEEQMFFLENDSVIELESKIQFVLDNFEKAKECANRLRQKIFVDNSIGKAVSFYNTAIGDLLKSSEGRHNS